MHDAILAIAYLPRSQSFTTILHYQQTSAGDTFAIGFKHKCRNK